MRRLLTMAAAAALLLGACGDDDGAADAADDATTTSDTALDPQPDATHEGAAVVAATFAFEPPTVEVAAGEAVTWQNEDAVRHTVTAGTPGEPSGDFDESLPAGATAGRTFDEAGTYPYFCAIHPRMTGEVVVR